VLGILLFTKRIHFFLYEKITSHSWFEQKLKTKVFVGIIVRPGPYVLQLLSTGLAAWLATAGILLYNFYTIQLLTSVWTIIASPFIVVLSFLGYFKLLVGLLLPTAVSMLDIIIKPLSNLLIWLVKLMAQVDISQFLIGHVPAWLIILYYCLILFAGFVYLRRPMLKKAACTVMALIIISFLGVTKWQRTYPHNFTMTCLDVGHGQAILAQMPGGTNFLFDAGSAYKSNIGRKIVAPFLRYIGVNKIHRIIISHGDIDHINGIPEIVEECSVEGIFAGDAFFSVTDQWGTVNFLKQCLNKKGLEIRLLAENPDTAGNAKVKILWPNEQAVQNIDLGANDKSLVSLIEFAGSKTLLCSDIEKFAQRELMQLYPALKANVVVVPHHGSVKTLEADFLEKLEAHILLVSCSRKQYEQQQVLIQANNAKLFYTPRHGAITICINKKGTIKTTTFVK